MENKSKYIIVQATLLTALIREINRLIDEGYMPIGGMVLENNTSSYASETRYYQTMIIRKYA